MKKDLVLIKHILEAIERSESYLENTEFPAFQGNRMMIAAVVRELTIIGEASAHISDHFRAEHPKIPFYEAIGMRNQIVHQYWEVNEKTLWDTCKDDLPILKEKLLAIN